MNRSGSSRAPAAPAVPVQNSGRLDSLWNSSLPTDTLFLASNPAASQEALLPPVYPLRRGPSSVVFAGQETVWGWRVQLASSSDRSVLDDVVARVEREFGTEAYIEDLGGKFALRIGAFDNLNTASRERDRAVSYGYKTAWVVQTKIPPHQIQHEE